MPPIVEVALRMYEAKALINAHSSKISIYAFEKCDTTIETEILNNYLASQKEAMQQEPQKKPLENQT